MTIEPEPVRRSAKSSTAGKGERKKKGKQPAVEASSETSDDESGAESDRRRTARLGRSRKQIRFVDDDSDIPMATSPQEPKTPRDKAKSAVQRTEIVPRGKKRRRPTVSSSTSASDSEESAANEPQAPRKKLKRKFTRLAVSDLPKAKAGASSKQKSISDLQTESAVARKKGFQMIGGDGGEDEDDEEADTPPHPPPYIKKEDETGGNGVL